MSALVAGERQSFDVRPNSLRVNSSWMFAGKGVYAACQWGVLVGLTRLTDAGTVGQWGLAMAITAPVFALSDIEPRKNLFKLLEALRILVDRDWNGVLLMAGGSGPKDHEFQKAVHDLRLDRRVRMLGYVPPSPTVWTNFT